MISALACIPRGAAKARPVKDAPGEAELEQLKNQALESGGLEEMDDQSDGDEDEAESDGEGADGADGNDVEAAVRSIVQLDQPAKHRDWLPFVVAVYPNTLLSSAQVQHARAVAASMSTQSRKPSGGATTVEDAFRQLDMDHYDDEPDDLVSRLLQVRCCSAAPPCV